MKKDRLVRLLEKYDKYLKGHNMKITLQSTYCHSWCCVIDRCSCATALFSEVIPKSGIQGTGDTPEDALVDALNGYGIKRVNIR